jgi:hypothetical protein
MSIAFNIKSDPAYAWKAWGNQGYNSLTDVVGEFLDNEHQAEATLAHVDIVTENGQRLLKIEGNGKWDPITKDSVTKAFGYGYDPTTIKKGLNEHSCGMKHSLAYLDPQNSSWYIQIKQNGKVWELRAPYSDAMELKVVPKYLGKLTDVNNTLIVAPLNEKQYKTLYLSATSGPPKDSLLLPRLKKHLASLWIMKDSIFKGRMKMYLNDDFIEPYDILREKGVRIKNKHPPIEISLADGAPKVSVEVWHLNLEAGYDKDHPLFRRTMEYSGAVICKHGRVIKKGVFQEIYGKSKDYHFSGHLVLVNVSGDADGCPSTVTTKNDFNNKDPKLDGLYALIKEKAPAISTDIKYDGSKASEDSYKTRLLEVLTKVDKRRVESGSMVIDREWPFKISKNSVPMQTRERCDLVKIDIPEKTIYIYEAKIVPLDVAQLRQLFFYWRNVRFYCPDYIGWKIEPIFITVVDANPSNEFKDELIMINDQFPEFTPKYETFSEYNIN